MPSFHFDKEKYLRMAESEGIPAALTRLQKDMAGWEYEAFEGQEGYNPEMWKSLLAVREFARELWDLSVTSESSKKS